MNIRSIILKTHRLLGAWLSLLFAVWFLSAFVMIYHRYPRFTVEDAASLSPRITATPLLSPLSQYLHDSLPEAKLQSLTLAHTPIQGWHWVLQTTEHKLLLDRQGVPLGSKRRLERQDLEAVAAAWHSHIVRIDTVEQLDQWTPFARLRPDLPFYRLHLDRDARQVYVSSQDGRILTEHTSSERLWAWLGAIPHWVYFTWIRQNADLWIWLIIVLAGLGSLMTLGGLYLGLDMLWRTRHTKRGIHSPYRKRSYRWHHIIGSVCGIFILTWVFSGLMSVVDLPEWINGKPEHHVQDAFAPSWSAEVLSDTAGLDSLLKDEDVRSLRWTAIGHIPTLQLIDSAGIAKTYDARPGAQLRPLRLNQQDLGDLIARAYPSGVSWHHDQIEEYDTYYISRAHKLPLPVDRIQIEAPDAPTVYIHSERGLVKIVDRRSRIQAWLYHKLHSLEFTWLVSSPLAWHTTNWILLLLGTVTSITGVILGWRYFTRKRGKRR